VTSAANWASRPPAPDSRGNGPPLPCFATGSSGRDPERQGAWSHVAEIAEALIAGHGLVKLSARQVEAQLEHLERQKADIEAAIAALKAHSK
jgi:hypothetical protein